MGGCEFGMSRKPDRTFSLSEANALVPRVARVTADALRRLQAIREGSGAETAGDDALPPEALEEIQAALAEWSRQVQELGAQPKGFFTVDFPSPDPELLYCWTYGEDQIAFTHKVWENFSHRRPLADAAGAGGGHLKWVH